MSVSEREDDIDGREDAPPLRGKFLPSPGVMDSTVTPWWTTVATVSTAARRAGTGASGDRPWSWLADDYVDDQGGVESVGLWLRTYTSTGRVHGS